MLCKPDKTVDFAENVCNNKTPFQGVLKSEKGTDFEFNFFVQFTKLKFTYNFLNEKYTRLRLKYDSVFLYSFRKSMLMWLK